MKLNYPLLFPSIALTGLLSGSTQAAVLFFTSQSEWENAVSTTSQLPINRWAAPNGHALQTVPNFTAAPDGVPTGRPPGQYLYNPSHYVTAPSSIVIAYSELGDGFYVTPYPTYTQYSYLFSFFCFTIEAMSGSWEVNAAGVSRPIAIGFMGWVDTTGLGEIAGHTSNRYSYSSSEPISFITSPQEPGSFLDVSGVSFSIVPEPRLMYAPALLLLIFKRNRVPADRASHGSLTTARARLDRPATSQQNRTASDGRNDFSTP